VPNAWAYSPVVGTIVVNRREPRGTQGDRLRAYRIEVDGIDRGRLRRRQTLRLDVAPGAHEIRARIDWQGSETVQLDVPEEGEVVVWVETVDVRNAWRLFFRREGWLAIRVGD
jgi:hypothetical protein